MRIFRLGLRRVEKLSTEFCRRLLNLPRMARRSIVVGADILTALVATFFAFYLRLGDLFFPLWSVVKVSLISIAIFVPIFFLFGIYRNVYRFSGIRLIYMLAAATAVYAVIMAGITLFAGLPNVPRTIGVVQPIVFLLMLTFSRMFGRQLLTDLSRHRGFEGEEKRVLIYGAGNAGQQLALSMREERGVNLRGFVDDDSRLGGQRLDGVRIFHSSRIASAIEQQGISHIFLAIPSVTRVRRREIIDSLQDLRVHVQTLPSLQQLVDQPASLSDLRDMKVEDLLGRDPVQPNELLMGRTIAGKTVLVTGAGGSIGGELARQIVRMRPARLVLFEMSEHGLYQIERDISAILAPGDYPGIQVVQELGNAADAPTVERLFERWRPDTVFHAAAYKHVPLVECNNIAGLKNNILSTRLQVEAAKRTGVAHFILISTDKAVRPTNIMGASKRICELILQAHAEEPGEARFAMVRFGNVLGSSGSVVPLFRQQIEAGGPVTLTHREITRYFMTIPEAAQLVIQAGAMAKGGEVYVLDMGEPIRIYDLARSMINLSGLSERTDVNPDGDIEIREVGLRPGEKLYEELLIGDSPEPTSHSRIMRARENMIPLADLERLLDDMLMCLNDADGDGARSLVRRLVPEYRSPAELGVSSAG